MKNKPANELYKEYKTTMKTLYNCYKASFVRYVNHHQLKEIQGEWFHSNYYIDKFGAKLAYMETSSWGADPIYKIAEETNYETLSLVNNIFNDKF